MNEDVGFQLNLVEALEAHTKFCSLASPSRKQVEEHRNCFVGLIRTNICVVVTEQSRSICTVIWMESSTEKPPPSALNVVCSCFHIFTQIVTIPSQAVDVRDHSSLLAPSSAKLRGSSVNQPPSIGSSAPAESGGLGADVVSSPRGWKGSPGGHPSIVKCWDW